MGHMQTVTHTHAHMDRMQTWTGHTDGYSRGNLIQFDEEANEEEQGADVGGQQSICHIHIGGKGGDTVCSHCGPWGWAGQGRAGQAGRVR